jgi:hypothetical protein
MPRGVACKSDEPEAIPAGISRPGSIPLEAVLQTEAAWGVPAAGSLLFYFCRQILRVILLVFVLVSAAIDDKSCFKFKWLWR